jgi:hypothetical protein
MRMRWLLVPVVWVVMLLVFDATSHLPNLGDLKIPAPEFRTPATVIGWCDYYLAYSTRNGGMPALVRFCNKHQSPPATARDEPLEQTARLWTWQGQQSASAALLGACTGSQASPTVLYGPPQDGTHCQAVDIGFGRQRWVLVLPEPARNQDCYWLTKSCEPRDIRRAKQDGGQSLAYAGH